MDEKPSAIETTPSVFDQDGPTDAQLLGRFVDERNQTAFETLLHTHGPMVLGVCQRILMRHHDAEDAFQATFLSLAQNAHRIGRREQVVNWLYTVARHMAINLKKIASKRRQVELQLEHPMNKNSDSNLDREIWSDLAPILDREIGRLSADLRVAVILCDVEGKTRKEASRQLGCPEATVSTRLMKARSLLAQRSKRQGVVLTATTLGVLLSQNAASAAVPASLVATTLQTASVMSAGQTVSAALVSPHVIALTKGTAKSLLLVNLQIAGAVLMLLVTAGLAFQSQAEKQPIEPKAIDVANVPERNGQELSATDVLRKCLETQSTRNRIRAKVTSEIQQDAPLRKVMSQCIFVRCNDDFSISARVRCSGPGEEVRGAYYDTGHMVKRGVCVDFQEWEGFKRQKAQSPSIVHGAGITTSDPVSVDDRVASFLQTAEFGAFLDGFVLGIGKYGSKKTLADLMLEGDIGAYDPESQVNGVKCYLVNSSTRFGDLALWVSHTGFQVLQFDLVKSPQHLFGGRKQNYTKLADEEIHLKKPITKWSAKLRDVTLTNVNGVEVPTQGTLQYAYSFKDGTTIIETYKASRTEVDLSEDATSSDRFTLDLEDGARLSDFDDLASGAQLVWKGSEVHKAPEDLSVTDKVSKPMSTAIRWFVALNVVLFVIGYLVYRRRTS